MTYREGFSDDQWRTLEFAPFLVLSGVSGRYRGFAPEELVVFERWLAAASEAPGALNRELLGSVHTQLDELTVAYSQFEGTITSGLTQVAEILSGPTADEGQLLRESLIQVLGHGLAKARGPYGRVLTTEAEQMLTMLDEFLRPGVMFGTRPGDAA